MMIGSINRTSNPKIAYGMLAKQTLEQLRLDDQTGTRSPQFASLPSILRMIDAYLKDAFFEDEPGGIFGTPGGVQKVRLIKTQPRLTDHVTRAFEAARLDAFPDEAKEAAMGVVQRVVRFVYDRNSGVTAPSQEELQKTARFFETLIEKLK